MISPCPPYYSSALSCLLRSHHVLLFRLVASDCLSCSAKLGRSVLSSFLALSFSMPFASCIHLLSCYSARILSALLCHEAASIWYWEARLRLSHQGTQTGCGCHTRAPKPISVSCVCRGAEARNSPSHAKPCWLVAATHPESTTNWSEMKVIKQAHCRSLATNKVVEILILGTYFLLDRSFDYLRASPSNSQDTPPWSYDFAFSKKPSKEEEKTFQKCFRQGMQPPPEKRVSLPKYSRPQLSTRTCEVPIESWFRALSKICVRSIIWPVRAGRWQREARNFSRGGRGSETQRPRPRGRASRTGPHTFRSVPFEKNELHPSCRFRASPRPAC